MNGRPVNLLAKFHVAAQHRTAIGGSLTLAQYADRFGDQTLKNLAGAINEAVYDAYKRNLKHGIGMSFEKFLLEKAYRIENALNTPEFKKAKTDDEKKSTIRKFIEKIKGIPTKIKEKIRGTPEQPAPTQNASARPPRDVFSVPSDDCCEQQQQNSQESSVLKFYSKFASKSAVAPQQASIARNLNVTESRKTNIVVQPAPKTGKLNNNKTNVVVQPKKTDSFRNNGVAKQVDSMDAHLENLENSNFGQVPRSALNKVLSHIAEKHGQCVPDCDEARNYAKLYARAVDLSHGGFDACCCDQLSEAMKNFQEGGIDALPKRERRALADLLERAPQDVLDELKTKNQAAFDFAVANKETLQVAAETDLLNSFGPTLLNVVSKHLKSNSPQFFVVAHNDTPILRHLLNNGQDDRLARYMVGLRLVGEPKKNEAPKCFEKAPKLSWNPSLSHVAPLVSNDGKIAIYASAPFVDKTSFFDLWLSKSKIDLKNGSVFLAPTDEVIVASGLMTKWDTMDEEAQKKWLLSHQAKATQGVGAAVKNLANGQGNWITQYKTVYGQDVKAVVKSRVVEARPVGNDKASKACLVPIGKILVD